MHIPTYRDARAVHLEHVEELLARYRDRLASPEYRTLARIARRRVARIVAGVVGAFSGVLAFVASLWNFTSDTRNGSTPSGVATALLGASWALFGGGFTVARIFGRWFVRPFERTELRRVSEDPVAHAERLARADPLEEVIRYVRKREWLGVGMPATFLALGLPLTLHFVIYFLFIAPNASAMNINININLSGNASRVRAWELDAWTKMTTLRDFDNWIGLSAILVGFAHFVFVLLSLRYARVLARTSTSEVLSTQPPWSHAFYFILGATCLPAIVQALFFGVEYALFVFVVVVPTGFVVVPLVFGWIRRTVLAERELAEKARTT